MQFGSAWLLAFVCLVLGGCAVAALPPPPLLIPTGPVPRDRASTTDNNARLGPPSPRGLGRRRVDSADSTSAPLARE